MPEKCPKCGAVNSDDRSTCVACGAELEMALYAEMFGPPKLLQDRYRIQRLLQQGSEVSVYQAIDIKDGNRPCLVHQVAVTSVPVDQREILEQRFLDQASAWRRQQHPSLLRILDADVQNHRLYLVTEPQEGVSLRSIIQDRRQSISEQVLLHWAGQLCDLLTYLHSQQPPVVLGCLSPAVLSVDEAGQVKLTEVGLIRYKQSGLLGPARGVRGYAAPEQRQGEPDPQSDIYSLGLILYEVITRFDMQERPLPPLQKYAHGFSEQTLTAITQTYRREPEKRYRSAAEMRQALLGSAPEQAIELPPLSLVEGQSARSLPELVQLCVTLWDEGLLALMTGRITGWLQASDQALREQGQDAQAVQLAQAAARTAQAQEQIEQETARPGVTAQAREIGRNTAYADWLRDMGALGIQPSLEIRPTDFDFGVVGARVKAKSAIQVRNRGQGYLSGRVESALPWLVVTNPIFGCRAGEAAEVQVEALGRRLPTGETASRQAIQVSSNGGSAWIAAQASSSPPVLRVQEEMLDFGPITRGASRVAHLTVANFGGGRLTGLVTSRAPWLRIRHPTFSCPAGASAQISVELVSHELPAKAVRIRRALVIDSDSGQAQVDVAWKWARPILDVDTVGLDLGSVQRGLRVERTVRLANTGTADLVGEAASAVPWLAVAPAQFRCPPGSSLAIQIVCNTALLPGGSTIETEAVTIRANAGVQTLSVTVEILAPRLIVESSFVDLGDVQDGEQAEETIMVGNRGSMPWQGRVRANVPWLTVEPEALYCEPGHFMPVTVMLNPGELAAGGAYEAAAAVTIDTHGEERTIGARVNLLRPELNIERHSLDFGLIGRTDIVTLPLELTNSGTGELNWEISVQGTWLEAIPRTGTCAAGETTVVQVRSYALAVDGESGQAWLTVRSSGGRVDLPAMVALSSPVLVVEPLYLELASENYAPASQSIRISNRGVGELKGTVTAQVPWLSVDPASFVCPTGVSVQIQVLADPAEMRAGTFHAPHAIRVESNAGQEAIQVDLRLDLYPRLHVPVSSIDLTEQTEAMLILENQGYDLLHVQLVPTADWILIDRREWTIKAGKEVRAKISRGDRTSDQEGSIEVRTADELVRLPVFGNRQPVS